ncbi:MAG: hypothetical protein Q9160_007896 [Pyrenula sp. 1 TL-2023]
MADVETAAQKQARIRRERREAKIKAGASSRLDRITQVSGRNPELGRDASPSPSPSPAHVAQTAPTPPPQSSPANAADPAQLQAQEDFLRNMLRAQPQEDQTQQQQNDPTMRLLQSILGNTEESDPSQGGAPSISPEDISEMTGIPSFMTKTFLGRSAAPTPQEQKTRVVWNVVHVLYAMLAGLYMLYAFRSSVALYGRSPPPPATVRNPFLVFLTGELLVEGGKVVHVGKPSGKSFAEWFQMLKDFWRDACIVVFVLGLGKWLGALDVV